MCLCFVLAGISGYGAFVAHYRKHNEGSGKSGTPVEPEWSAGFEQGFGEVVDIKVRNGFAFDRYAIACDVLLANTGDVPVSVSVDLSIKYGALGSFPVWAQMRAQGSTVSAWEGILRAFAIQQARQLLFPLDLAPKTSQSGHIVFPIEEEGACVGRELMETGSNVEREYEIHFIDNITNERKRVKVGSVFAPRLDGSGIVNHTDLAVAGGASVWVVHDGAALSSHDLALQHLSRQTFSGATAPDVWLEGTFPPGPFKLRARGHACEIRTGPIVQESCALGLHKDGDRTMRTISPRYTIEFPVVSDLRDGDQEVAPSLLCGEGYSRGRWPEKESKREGMAEFLRMAEYARRFEIGEPDVNTCTEAELNDFAERIRRPLTFRFEITFWNSDHTQQWKRSELLVHEPVAGMAFVRHTGAPERLVATGENP